MKRNSIVSFSAVKKQLKQEFHLILRRPAQAGQSAQRPFLSVLAGLTLMFYSALISKVALRVPKIISNGITLNEMQSASPANKSPPREIIQRGQARPDQSRPCRPPSITMAISLPEEGTQNGLGVGYGMVAAGENGSGSRL